MIISRILWTLGWYVILAAKLFLKIIKKCSASSEKQSSKKKLLFNNQRNSDRQEIY